MSAKLEEMRALAAQAAQTGPDMTEATAGGGRTLPEGYAFGRIVEYVELGVHPQEYQGQAKDPMPEAQIAFALWGEGYQNDDGTPYIIRPYSFTIGRNPKAKAFKLFKALNWKGTCTHFAQLIGEAILVKIIHVKAKDGSGKVSSRVDFDGFLPPLDPVTRTPYAIPEARDEDLKLFLQEYPSLEGWAALYQEGKWDDGSSKNRVQETILSALDFAGSPLETLLKTSGNMPAMPVAAPQAPAAPVGTQTPAASLPAAPVVAAVPFAPPAESAPAIPAPASVGAPASVATPATTSPSNVAIPALPSIPALPTIPQ